MVFRVLKCPGKVKNMYGEECVTRDEAEQMIKNGIEDYLSIDQLQEILETIFGDDIMVVENDDIYTEED